jgi:hypothetical protein
MAVWSFFSAAPIAQNSPLNNEYRISSYSFRRNYSFFHSEIQRSHNIRPKVTLHKGEETIQWRKLFKGGNYMRYLFYRFLYPMICGFISGDTSYTQISTQKGMKCTKIKSNLMSYSLLSSLYTVELVHIIPN